MSKHIKTITQNSSLMFIGKIFDSFIMFAFNVLAAKFIGAADYGAYVYLSALVMFASIAIKFGMDQGLTALVPKQEDLRVKKSIISFSFYGILLISGIFMLLAFVGSDFIAEYMMNNASYGTYVIYVAPLFLLYALMHLSEGIFRTIGAIKPFVLAKNMVMPVAIVVAFVVLHFGMGYKNVEVLIVSNYFGWILSVGYLTIYLIRNNYLVKLEAAHSTFYKQLLVLSSGLILVGLLDYLVGRIDAYIVGYLMDESFVGIYNVYDKIAYLSGYFFVAFGSIMAPYIAEIYHKGKLVELGVVYHFVTKVILLINGAIFGFLLINIHWILGFFGPDYTTHQWVMIILLMAYFVNALGGPVIYMNTMTGNGKAEIHIGMISLLANALLDIFLIGSYGILGVAMATLGVFLIALLVRLRILYKTQRLIPITKGYLLTLVIIGLATAVASLLYGTIEWSSVWLERILVTLIYGASILVPAYFVVLTKKELNILLSLVKKEKI